MSKITLGNITVNGFVNFVKDNRFLLGTGGYETKAGDKVFFDTITVFTEGEASPPSKGERVSIRGRIEIRTREDGSLSATMNVRFPNQISAVESRSAAPAAAGDDDDI